MKKALVRTSAEAIKSHFENQCVDKNALLSKYPQLREHGASFVTLRKNNQLRGCIGSLFAHRSLIEDVIENAKAAAFKDPRFLPLKKEELELTTIELSLLTSSILLDYKDKDDLKDKIRPGIDGVILKHKGLQATFLPQVWDQLNEFESFFIHLGKKAGLHNKYLDEKPDIYVYQVEKIKTSF